MARKAKETSRSLSPVRAVPEAATTRSREPELVVEEERLAAASSALDLAFEWAERLRPTESGGKALDARSFEELGAKAISLMVFLQDCLTEHESNFDDTLLTILGDMLREFCGAMDEQGRKKTIAGLMAYIGELQTAGVLEATPSDRLARVAMLIGEAAALVKAKVPASTNTLLFENRQADPKTGEKCTAIEWYNIHWRERVEAGDVFANDIKHADLKLYQAIASHQRRAGKTLSELIPVRVPRNQFDDTPEGQVARAKHLREQNARNVRRYRQRKSAKPS